MNGLNNQQIPQPPVQMQQIPAAEFAAKYRSKRECYNFLAVDAGTYLPSYGKYAPSSSAERCRFLPFFLSSTKSKSRSTS